MMRAVAALLAAVLVAVIAARLLFLATVRPDVQSAAQPWSQPQMEFVAWDNERWTAWILKDKFVLQPREPGTWQRHVNTSLAFIDWQGRPWQAKVDGKEFLLAPRGDWKGRAERARALRYRDWRGDRQVRTVAQLQHRH
ncbi:MAG TPA: hypothetical protein VGQ22_08590 [Steroidobacteraceae bacterium]|jgi:hypothetical protein|nr:hypothetical protein [Steroidobacteraceae bacterium]